MHCKSRFLVRGAAIATVCSLAMGALATGNFIAFVPPGFFPTAISADGNLVVGFMSDGVHPPNPAKWAVGASTASPITSQPGKAVAVAADDKTFLLNIQGPGSNVFEIMHPDGTVEPLETPTIPGVTFTNQTTADYITYLGHAASGFLVDSHGGHYSAFWPEHVAVPVDSTPVTITRGGDAAVKRMVGGVFSPTSASTAARWHFESGSWHRFAYAKPGTAYFTAATGMSLDGTTAVGASALHDSLGHTTGSQAAKWEDATGAITLLAPFASEFESAAATSADGMTVVGAAFDTSGNFTRAIFWDGAGVAHDLKADLVAAGVPGLSSIGLADLIGVSQDGSMMLGYTTDHVARGFVAHLEQKVHLRHAWADKPIIVGGLNTNGHIYLDRAAPSNLSANVKSDNGNVQVLVPAVQLPTGAGAALVPLSTKGVDLPQDAIIEATLNDRSVVFVQRIIPASLFKVVSNKASEISGAQDSVTCYLDGLAGPSGRPLTISTDHPTILAPITPHFVVQPAHGTASTVLNSFGVDADTPVVISVTDGAHILTTTNTVVAAHLDHAFNFHDSVVGGAHDAVLGYLNGLAGPSGKTLPVSCSSASVVLPSMAQIVISGNHLSASMPFETKGVDATVTTNLVVTDGAITKNAPLKILPAIPFAVKCSPNPVTGGGSLAINVYLNGQSGPSGGTIFLHSSDPAVLSVPTSIPIGAFKTLAGVSVTTGVPSGSSEVVTVTATYNGTPLNGTVTVNHP